ncbi:MAG: hypothetical protein ACD_21C00250G0032 [uncultured bacterium]|nr:MAG: hypothetical protein ACD_21C00250G0032 [uncultured bacterium]
MSKNLTTKGYNKVLTLFRKLFRLVDFALACIFFLPFLVIVALTRTFGKLSIKNPKKTVFSLTKDGIYRILECNGPKYFEWDFTRPHADLTYILFIGNEKPNIFKLGKKIIGINIVMPLEKYRQALPYTTRSLQQIWGMLLTAKLIKKILPEVLEVMFPSKIALRAMLIKFLFPIKLVTQVRGNLDLIYYFNPFPCFWPFKMTFPPFEVFQTMWDKLISLLFYRSCDLVIGYNVNNMLSAISNGSHPSKTKLSRIKIELSMLNVKPKPREEIDGVPKNGKIISLWSRLSQEKLVLESVQAFEKLLYFDNSDLHFIIIGDGPEKSRIQSYLSTSKCKERVHLLGQKDRDSIAQIALHSSLSVVPYGGELPC